MTHLFQVNVLCFNNILQKIKLYMKISNYLTPVAASFTSLKICYDSILNSVLSWILFAVLKEALVACDSYAWKIGVRSGCKCILYSNTLSRSKMDGSQGHFTSSHNNIKFEKCSLAAHFFSLYIFRGNALVFQIFTDQSKWMWSLNKKKKMLIEVHWSVTK